MTTTIRRNRLAFFSDDWEEAGRPMPEMVDPRHVPYRYFDSTDASFLPTNGMTDLKNRLLVAPIDDQATKRHELAHAKWSLVNFPELTFDARAFQAVEDGRINLGLARIGIPLELDAPAIEQVLCLLEGDIKERQWTFVSLRTVAAIGTNALEPMLELVECRAKRRGRTLRKRVMRVQEELLDAAGRRSAPVATPKQARSIAEWLAHELGLDRPGPAGRRIACACLGFGGEIGAAGHAHGIIDTILGDRGGSVPSGKMSISEVPLPEPCGVAPAKRRPRYVAASEGILLRYPERYPIDQAVFCRRKRSNPGGGTALIDTSGSMRLTASQVDSIVRESPAGVTVAMYSGSGSRGELRIVARGGMRASKKDLKPHGSGNIVDAPALEWLATQPAPRVWMSDGGVTGVDDAPSASVRRRCRAACVKGRIRVAENVEQVVEALRRA